MHSNFNLIMFHVKIFSWGTHENLFTWTFDTWIFSCMKISWFLATIHCIWWNYLYIRVAIHNHLYSYPKMYFKHSFKCMYLTSNCCFSTINYDIIKCEHIWLSKIVCQLMIITTTKRYKASIQQSLHEPRVWVNNDVGCYTVGR